ncbi:MAG: hypothetical protein HY327_05395 [Chloroflexi bacterium]|nr:hypothetical protein [Chloroflexota bacterium]
MSLESVLTLTPQQPLNTIRTENGDPLELTAYVNFWNFTALAWNRNSAGAPTVARQAAEEWIYMGGTSAAPYAEDCAGRIVNRERSQIVEMGLQATPGRARLQILIVMTLRALGEHAMVRVGVNRQIVRTDHLTHGENRISILLDCPVAGEWTFVDLKHIQLPNGKASAVAFQETRVYLI